MQTRRLTLVAGALALTLTACSSSDGADSASTAATTAVTTATTTDSSTAAPSTGQVATNETAVFDPSVVHTISVDFDQDDYDAMIATYQDSGDKDWIEATVTIDGTTFERVGLRLKGNSSLAGLGGGGAGPGGGMPGLGGASADEPDQLPWLIRLDKFVDDQTYQDYEDFVVRSNNTETAMNEAVSLQLLTDAGLASQAAIATRFSVNGGDEVLRLVVEHPDDDQWYETRFDGDGALYKAESTGDWTYRGTDPASYDEIFDQEGGSDVADLTPLIELLDFVNNADDATFASELPQRLDVDAFATYLAMMELLGNSDDIDGPGNNAYLWWDAATEQFTVVPWDMNLTLGSGMGFGGGAGGGGGFPGGQGGQFPGGSLPEGAQPPDGGNFPGGGGFGGRSNPLVERFLADDGFNARYEARLAGLREQLFASGTAQTVLDTWTALLTGNAGDLVGTDTIDSEAATIRDFIDQAARG